MAPSRPTARSGWNPLFGIRRTSTTGASIGATLAATAAAGRLRTSSQMAFRISLDPSDLCLSLCRGPIAPRACGELEVPGQPQCLQRANADPVEVDLVPREAVTRAGRVRVMVVVPALAKRQQRHPPVVGRIIAGVEPA